VGAVRDQPLGLPTELIRMKVDIIVVAGGGAPLRAAKQATRLSANY